MSMRTTWVFFVLAVLLFTGTFLLLFAMENGPICKEHPFLPGQTVCEVVTER